MWTIYKITCILDGRVYIGQTVQVPSKRWTAHKCSANIEKPVQYLHHAMKKYKIQNFIFEPIASCKTSDDAEYLEAFFIIQYDSMNKDKGFNIKLGGKTAGHSDETKEKLRITTTNWLKRLGHPSLGKKRTPEQIITMCAAQQKVENRHNKATRKKMSESHKGEKHSPETIAKRTISIQKIWDKRSAEKEATGEIKCNFEGCNIQGCGIAGARIKYKFFNGIRYCSRHGQRLVWQEKKRREKESKP